MAFFTFTEQEHNTIFLAWSIYNIFCGSVAKKSLFLSGMPDDVNNYGLKLAEYC